MIKLLRYWRHGPLKHWSSLWVRLGKGYRWLVEKLHLPISVSMSIGRYGPYRVQAYFAFSDLEHWGMHHNNGFDACINACRGKHCVVDVGAHVGWVTLPMSSVIVPGGKVLAFEPACVNFWYLARHVSQNKLMNVELYTDLVGDQLCDDVLFYERKEVSGMNSLVIKKDHEQYRVTQKHQITLDHFFSHYPLLPQIIKIDVEGAEMKVLQGAIDTLKRCHPWVFLSVHPVEMALLQTSFQALRDLVENIGYRITHVDGSSVETFTLKEYILRPL